MGRRLEWCRVPPLFCSLKLARGHNVSHDAGGAVSAQINDEAFGGHRHAPDEQLNDAGLLARKELTSKLGEVLERVDATFLGDLLAVQRGNDLRCGFRCAQNTADFCDDSGLSDIGG